MSTGSTAGGTGEGDVLDKLVIALEGDANGYDAMIAEVTKAAEDSARTIGEATEKALQVQQAATEEAIQSIIDTADLTNFYNRELADLTTTVSAADQQQAHYAGTLQHTADTLETAGDAANEYDEALGEAANQGSALGSILEWMHDSLLSVLDGLVENNVITQESADTWGYYGGAVLQAIDTLSSLVTVGGAVGGVMAYLGETGIWISFVFGELAAIVGETLVAALGLAAGSIGLVLATFAAAFVGTGVVLDYLFGTEIMSTVIEGFASVLGYIDDLFTGASAYKEQQDAIVKTAMEEIEAMQQKNLDAENGTDIKRRELALATSFNEKVLAAYDWEVARHKAAEETAKALKEQQKAYEELGETASKLYMREMDAGKSKQEIELDNLDTLIAQAQEQNNLAALEDLKMARQQMVHRHNVENNEKYGKELEKAFKEKVKAQQEEDKLVQKTWDNQVKLQEKWQKEIATPKQEAEKKLERSVYEVESLNEAGLLSDEERVLALKEINDEYQKTIAAKQALKMGDQNEYGSQQMLTELAAYREGIAPGKTHAKIAEALATPGAQSPVENEDSSRTNILLEDIVREFQQTDVKLIPARLTA